MIVKDQNQKNPPGLPAFLTLTTMSSFKNAADASLFCSRQVTRLPVSISQNVTILEIDTNCINSSGVTSVAVWTVEASSSATDMATYTDPPAFVRYFLNEDRLGMRLKHADVPERAGITVVVPETHPLQQIVAGGLSNQIQIGPGLSALNRLDLGGSSNSYRVDIPNFVPITLDHLDNSHVDIWSDAGVSLQGTKLMADTIQVQGAVDSVNFTGHSVGVFLGVHGEVGNISMAGSGHTLVISNGSEQECPENSLASCRIDPQFKVTTLAFGCTRNGCQKNFQYQDQFGTCAMHTQLCPENIALWSEPSFAMMLATLFFTFLLFI